jgi:hypothetical protein
VTDLPRFTAGSLGPIGFNQVNEMMRRLDALRPFIESVELSQNGIDGAKESVMIVYAKQSTDPRWIGRYDWREIAIRSKDRDNETEVVANFEEEDWEEIETEVVTRGGKVVDEKGDELDTYAISAATSAFIEGFALCFARRSLDGTRRYVLLPIGLDEGEPSVRFALLWIVESVLGEVSVPMTGSTGGSLAAYVYVCRGLLPNSSSAGAGPSMIASEQVVPFYDFGPANENKPSVPEGTQLTAVPLKVGTVFHGFAQSVGVDEAYGFLALPPRFDVECL